MAGYSADTAVSDGPADGEQGATLFDRPRRWRWAAAGLVVVIVAAAAVAVLVRHARAASTPNVVIAKAVPATVDAYPTGVGTVRATLDDPISLGYQANIGLLFVTLGQHVTAGQPLFEVYPTFGRTLAQGAPVIVRAPISGSLISLPVLPGDGTLGVLPVAEIVNSSDVKVQTTIPLQGAGNIVVGQRATLYLSDTDGATLPGTVTAVVPAATAGGAAFTIVVTASNPHGVALPGMQAFVRVDAVTHAPVTVPKLCVLDADISPEIFVESGDHVVLHQVQLGVTSLNTDQIVQGISAGQYCVGVGNQTLVSGQKVAVTGTLP